MYVDSVWHKFSNTMDNRRDRNPFKGLKRYGVKTTILLLRLQHVENKKYSIMNIYEIFTKVLLIDNN